MFQAHIFYSGTVQGVGFRYTAQQCARDLRLTGRVRNLQDGRVEITVEGEKPDIEEMISRLDKYFDGYIQDKKIEFSKASGQFKSFDVVH